MAIAPPPTGTVLGQNIFGGGASHDLGPMRTGPSVEPPLRRRKKARKIFLNASENKIQRQKIISNSVHVVRLPCRITISKVLRTF